MEKVKIFQTHTNTKALEFEEKINAWLAEMGDKIHITRVLQNAYGGFEIHIIITIFYEDKQ